MRKIIALLCAALLLLSSAALADTAAIDYFDRFEIRGTIPDGWHSTILSQSDMDLDGDIRPDADDPASAYMTVNICFNETYASVGTLKDLSETEMNLLRQTFDEYTVAFDTLETDTGVSLLVARETGDDQDFLVLYTIWQGYEIELTLLAGEAVPGRVLTDAQIGSCLSYAKSLGISAVAQ